MVGGEGRKVGDDEGSRNSIGSFDCHCGEYSSCLGWDGEMQDERADNGEQRVGRLISLAVPLV